jgi:glutamate-1-semialdehyde 2,1-aminomutase
VDDKNNIFYSKALEVLVGGVNSPSRSFKKMGLMAPLFISEARDAYLWDANGRQYIDYLAAFGPIILGHAHPKVTEAISFAAAKGPLYGAPHLAEATLGAMLQEAVPALDKVRFVNSGTEAVMTTVRLARAFTKRTKILKFAGCYHGHFDLALIEAGSGPATLGLASSAGLSEQLLAEVITIPFNDEQALEQVFRAEGEQLAAALIEPMVGNFGIVEPKSGFLAKLNKLAHQYGALVIYDEVISAFRFHYGAAQDLYQVQPDLTALGKIIGGGLPIGAYGGRADIMSLIAPEGPVYQAGTMAGNPLSMAAGIACLEELKQQRDKGYQQMANFATVLKTTLEEAADQKQLPLVVNQLKGAFSVHFTSGEVTNYAEAMQADDQLFNQFFKLLLKEGIYTAPSKYEAWFVSLAHTEEDIAKTALAIRKVLAQMSS